MKKIIVKLSLIISLVLLIWPSLSYAQLANLKNATPDLLQRGTIYDIVGTFIQILLGFIGVLFIVLVIYGGFSWMTAGGDSSKVQKAKDTIIKATIGLVIILASYAIVYTLTSQLLGET
ncbi:MAG: hypothetical protein Q7K65_04195 [Candidatus Buchananbacteria bacterium]|nr:hypothetical protein [Candidatus Buchananbacteria bacterium]